MQEAVIHSCDDWLSCEIGELETVHLASHIVSELGVWKEVVAGIDSLAVQFDPAKINPAEAVAKFQDQLTNVVRGSVEPSPPVTIPVCYDAEFAPDMPWIAGELGLTAQECAAWHSALAFNVTILGFMPGFAYLQTETEVQDIGRLDSPRQKVAAGSIGIIGGQNCIYSFDSPGGWPIIGRTPIAIFDPENRPPNKLSAGQKVIFEAIDRAEYDNLLKARSR